ncbi:OprD family porin [Halopseudomonas nanhaiensis]|uniref:OprD family porin n=1 Tax=Pseudomonadaceae TaxID=135621 RepID=UPI00123A4602|nr:MULTISPECIES: OprD family porin [Pseudomonadaceae]UAW98648.1 OprD family porin [Halopseudomonas nanhaiensis]
MNKKISFTLIAASVIVAAHSQTLSAEELVASGFVDGSDLSVLNRNFYFNRDDRNGQFSPKGTGYSEAWAHGVIANFESGFTQGTVGFGLDAFAMLGLKLDTSEGRNGGNSSFDMLPVNSDGEAMDEYTKLGAAVKLSAFDTVVQAGDVFPTTPVVHYGDSRLLPESFRGVTLVHTRLENLTVQGGRLTGMSQPTSSNMLDDFETFYAGPVDSPWVAYFGGDYSHDSALALSLYTSRLKDAWDQKYIGVASELPLSEKLSLFGGFNYYNSTDQGKDLLGEFDTDIWSARIGVASGAHSISLSHQRNHGDNDFDYLRQSDSIFLDHSLQYSDFNSPKERSWMVRYDLDMSEYGVPGLSFMTRYATGRDADYSNANAVYMREDADGNPLTDQKRWERNVEARYIVQTGQLQGLSFRLRQATTRATAFESDLDEVRVIIEYPFDVI